MVRTEALAEPAGDFCRLRDRGRALPLVGERTACGGSDRGGDTDPGADSEPVPAHA
ncbi:hypothetical protein [Streptomyces sp. NPDC052036]|uniref:hypothetical protein n=1 Tax=unclassified Streptomyces TaxID=2593676 RepID=UPI00341E0B7E